MGQAAYLEYLQAVCKKFDLVAAANKEILIWCLQKGLRLSIQAKIYSQHWELDSWDEIFDNTIEAKSKIALQSSTSVHKIDACY